jgi:hypothetical protein
MMRLRSAELSLHEAGTAQAGTVVAVQDGADWLRHLLDAHCPEAVRILDFPHAAKALSRAAQACFGLGMAETGTWLERWLHELKHGYPEDVIAAIRALPAPTSEAAAGRDGAAACLHRRRAQIRYAAFQAQGYPIGSGMVESDNKLVVEAWPKGVGMHWHRQNVTPMLALRAQVCNGTWEEEWPSIWQYLCATARARSTQRRNARQEARQTQPQQDSPAPPRQPLPTDPLKAVAGRPTEHHPWKHGYDQRPSSRPKHVGHTLAT